MFKSWKGKTLHLMHVDASKVEAAAVGDQGQAARLGHVTRVASRRHGAQLALRSSYTMRTNSAISYSASKIALLRSLKNVQLIENTCPEPYVSTVEPFSGVEIHMEMDMDCKWMDMGHIF